MTSPSISHFSLNTLGRDWVVGDIHGHFTKLEDRLSQCGFNPTYDRLFSVGDLVDRGPESARVLEWLDYPWFHPILGNHEEMLVLYTTGQWPESNYIANGGEWFVALSEDERLTIASRLVKLPLAIDIETRNGKVGLIHANTWIDDWENLEASLQGNPQGKDNQQELLWGRMRLHGKITAPMKGVWAVFCGHTPVKERTILGNFHYIDTGAWAKPAPFRFFNVETLLEVLP